MSTVWNFPCWQDRDRGPTYSPRADKCGMWEIGPGAQVPSTQPFTSAGTIIFAFLIRSGWTAEAAELQGIMSIGVKSASNQALNIEVSHNASGNSTLKFWLWDQDSTLTRHDAVYGDEDGASWLQADKWYQCGVDFSASGVTMVVNGSITPTATVTTSATGFLNLDYGAERLWIPGNGTNTVASTPQASTAGWSTLVRGPMAMDNQRIGLADADVRARIWDGNGDFKFPGENGSKWFQDAYTLGAFKPDIFLLDGSCRFDNGRTQVAWYADNGGGSGFHSVPGGLKKQYV